MDVIYCYVDMGIKAIVIHSPLLFILSFLDRPFIYLCHLFHSSPHVFFIMLLFSPLVLLFLLYNYQYAEARFTITQCGGREQAAGLFDFIRTFETSRDLTARG